MKDAIKGLFLGALILIILFLSVREAPAPVVRADDITVSLEDITFTNPGESQVVFVTNEGGVTINSVTSSDPDVFLIRDNTCDGSSEDCSFTVLFRPESLDDYSGTVTIDYDGGFVTITINAFLSRSSSVPIPCSKAPSWSPTDRKPKTVFVILTRVGACK